MRVSVIIPVFNAAKYVKDAVKSVLQQEEVGEILIVDDGSTDGGLEICKDFSNNFENVKLLYHVNNANLGPSATRNLGIKNAQYKLIAFLDADDIYNVNRFEKSLSYFKHHPEADMTFEPAAFYKVSSSDHFQTIFFTKSIEYLSDFECYFLQKQGWITLNSTTFRKSSFDIVGYFDHMLRQAEDTDFILRCFKQLQCIGIKNQYFASFARDHKDRSVKNLEISRKYKSLLYAKWLPIILAGNHHPQFVRKFLNHHIYYSYDAVYLEKNKTLRILKKLYFVSCIMIRNPKLFLKIL